MAMPSIGEDLPHKLNHNHEADNGLCSIVTISDAYRYKA